MAIFYNYNQLMSVLNAKKYTCLPIYVYLHHQRTAICNRLAMAYGMFMGYVYLHVIYFIYVDYITRIYYYT